MAIPILLGLAFMLVSVSSNQVGSVKRIQLDSYSEDGVQGCYTHMQLKLGVCFDVKKGNMKIEKSNGELLVHYKEPRPGMFYYQLLDKAFIGHGPHMLYLPDDVAKTPDTLQAALNAYVRSDNLRMKQNEALKTNFQQVTRALHDVPEMQLLELVSAALGVNYKRLEVLQPFHALSLNLLKQADIDIPYELRAARAVKDDQDETAADQQDGGKRMRKRCTSMENRHDINCRGMCGKMCSCWSWFCGDCCWHRGCYEHDLCCNYNKYSSYCLTPFFYGLKCSSFGGYPKCKGGSWWG